MEEVEMIGDQMSEEWRNQIEKGLIYYVQILAADEVEKVLC